MNTDYRSDLRSRNLRSGQRAEHCGLYPHLLISAPAPNPHREQERRFQRPHGKSCLILFGPISQDATGTFWAVTYLSLGSLDHLKSQDWDIDVAWTNQVKSSVSYPKIPSRVMSKVCSPGALWGKEKCCSQMCLNVFPASGSPLPMIQAGMYLPPLAQNLQMSDPCIFDPGA